MPEDQVWVAPKECARYSVRSLRFIGYGDLFNSTELKALPLKASARTRRVAHTLLKRAIRIVIVQITGVDPFRRGILIRPRAPQRGNGKK